LSFREQGRGVVSASEIISLLKNEGTARKVIHNLLRKGWITRLKGGRYLFYPGIRAGKPRRKQPARLASAWWNAPMSAGGLRPPFTDLPPETHDAHRCHLRQVPARVVEGNEIRFVKVVAANFSASRPMTFMDARPRSRRQPKRSWIASTGPTSPGAC